MNRRIVCCLAASLLTLPASTSLAGAKEDLAEATRLLDNVQEEKAIPLLLKAIERKDASPSQLAEMWALIAVAKFNLRDEAGSRAAFRRALDADSSVSISKLLPPKGWSVFEQARVERERELSLEKARADKEQQERERNKPKIEPPPLPTLVTQAKPAGTSGRTIAGIGVGAAGVVAAAIGVGLWANAGSLHSRAASETDAAKAWDLYRSGSTQNSAGVGLLIGGAAAAAVGVVLILLPDSDASKPAAVTTMTVGPTGVAISGTF